MRVPLCLWHGRTAVATVLHLALTAGNSGAAPSGLFGDELSRMFRNTPSVLHPPVDNPASIVSQPAAAYDSYAALSTSQMHGYPDVAHPDAMHQASPSHPTSLPVAHDYYPFTLSGFGALSSPSGQTHAMHEHTYGGPALGSHDHAGDELTPAYLPFMRMRSESNKEEEGDLPREVLSRNFSGKHGRPLDDAEINNLIKEGEAMIQRVHERTKNKRTKYERTNNTRTGMSYKVAVGNIDDLNWMQQVFEARMRQLLPPNEFDKYDPIVMVVDKGTQEGKNSNLLKGAKRILTKHQGNPNNIPTLRAVLESFDPNMNPLGDFTLSGVHFHVLTKNYLFSRSFMLSGNFRVIAVFPPNQEGTRIFMSVGKLSIKKKGGDESILSG